MGARSYRALMLALLFISAITGFAMTGKPSYGAADRPPGDVAGSTTAGTHSTATLGGGIVAVPQAHGIAIAKAEFETLITEHPADPSDLLQLAAEIRRYDTTDGVLYCERLVAAYPQSAHARVALARAFYENGNLSESDEALHLALKLRPDLPEGLLLRGMVLATDEPEGMDRALGEWRRVVERAPDSPAAREAARLIQLYEGR